MKEKKYVWVIEQTWKGGFRPVKVLKSDADGRSIKQHDSEKEAWETIQHIHIEPEH